MELNKLEFCNYQNGNEQGVADKSPTLNGVGGKNLGRS